MKKFIAVCVFLCVLAQASASPVVRFIYDGYRNSDFLNPNDAVGTVLSLVLKGDEDPTQLRTRPGFPAGFTRSYTLTNLATMSVFSRFFGQEVGQGEGEFFGSYVSGFIQAPQTGDYTFRMVGDDVAHFLLSTDHTPGNLKKIATSNAKPYSDPISLVKGRCYYFEIFHTQIVDANYFQIAWTLPDGTFEEPLRGKHVWTAPAVPAAAPAAITVHPQEGIIPERGSTTLTADILSIQPASGIWQRNGQEIKGANLSYIELGVSDNLKDGDLFTLVITNAFGATTSAPVRLSVVTDSTGPKILRALTLGNPNGVDLQFSEPMSEAGLATPGNYSINNGVVVEAVQILAEDKVRLKTTKLTPGVAYQVSAANLKDRSATGNPVTADKAGFYLVHGCIEKNTIWGLQPGGYLSLLTQDSRYTDQRPDEVGFKTKFETPDYNAEYFGLQLDGHMVPPPREGYNYGSWFRGYLTPPTNGNYTFYLACADEGILYLSDSENPAGKRQIAHQFPAYGRTPTTLINESGLVGEWDFVSGSWPRYYLTPLGNPFSRVDTTETTPVPSNRSLPIALQAGKKYYVEALFKDGAGYPNLAVTWEKPGDGPITDGAEPIGPEYLDAYQYPFAPVSFNKQPASLTVAEGAQIQFSAQAAGSPPYYYQWFMNGQPLPGSTNSTIQLTNVQREINLAEFTVVASNLFSSTTSQKGVLTIQYDDVPPKILAVEGSASMEQVLVDFSEALDYESAITLSNYKIAGLTLLEARVGADSKRVILTTSPQQPGKLYTLVVNGIKDIDTRKNTILPNTTVSFNAWKSAPGYLRAEYFSNLEGTNLDNLVYAPNGAFPDYFDSVRYLTSFKTPANSGDNFGVKISGFITPVKTGNHQFFIRSRHASRLYLSTDQQPANYRQIAEEDSCCNPFVADGKRSSAPINLEAGKKYYIEALFKAGTGEDYLEVAWLQPGETTSVSALQPIPGQYLSTITDPTELPTGAVKLSISKSGSQVTVSWPASGYVLQQTSKLENPSSWQDVADTSSKTSQAFPVETAPKFFRLKQ